MYLRHNALPLALFSLAALVCAQPTSPPLTETPIPGFAALPDYLVVNADGTRVVAPVGIVDTTTGHIVKTHKVDQVGAGTFSPDGSRVAFVGQIQKKSVAVIDGVPSKPYDGVGQFRFSKDSKRVMWIGRLNKKSFVNIDGQESQAYEEAFNPVFDPSGSHVAYVVKAGKKYHVVVDSVPGPAYDTIPILKADDNASTFRYVGADQVTHEAHIVSGDRVVKKLPFPEKSIKRISNDLARYAYTLKGAKDEHVVLDGLDQPSYDEISEIEFSPDGKRVAYVAKRGEKRLVVLDGKESKLHDDITGWALGGETHGFNALFFSPDGTRLAYVAKDDKRFRVVVDDAEQTPYGGIRDFKFSPNGKRVAYRATKCRGDGDGNCFMSGFDRVAVVDGREGSPYSEVFEMTFSPDGSRIAYGAFRQKKGFAKNGEGDRMMVIDDVESPPFAGLATVAADRTSVVFDTSQRARYFIERTTSKPSSYSVAAVSEGPH